MTLDVVIVTYNAAALLPAAVAGLPSGARVIVVDNASSDGSADVARRLGTEVRESGGNLGFAAAANLGAAAGEGELVLFLNPDAEVEPGLVRDLCQRLEDDPHLAVVSPALVAPDGSEQRVRWPYPSAPGAWAEALGLHRFRGAESDEGFVIGACFLVRRSAFDELGGFDTTFWLYGEETDLCRRALDAGWGVALADDLVARHVGGASGGGVEDLVFEHFQRGGEHFVRKHAGPRALLSYRLANLTGAVARSVLPGPGERRRLHRRRAERLARLLATAPTSVGVDSPATAAVGEGLVVCSLEPWDDVWRRNQFLVRELLRRDPGRRVLFVEQPYDRLLELRRPTGRRRRRGLRPLESDGRVVRFEPVKTWPRVLGGAADRSLRRQVRRAARRLELHEPVLWVNDAHYAGLATEAGWPALYDITDDWAEAGGGRAARRVRSDESVLFDECGSVVVCSDGLAATRRDARPDLLVVPNAVDVEHLRRPRPRPGDLPPGPVAVYVGTLHEDRIDLDLVEELAERRPDVGVVLVGPDALAPSSRERLAGHRSVHLMGARPYEEVPAYLQHADVVIVPHVVSPFTESLDPIKAYECLAVGRPTVATPVAGFRDLGGPVRTAPPERFADEVTAVLEAGPALDPRPVPSWAERAAAFDAALAAARRRPALDVVVVDHCAQLSGGEIALLRVLPEVAARGVDVHLVLGEDGPLVERARAQGLAVEVLALDPAVAATRRSEVSAGGLGAGRLVAVGRDVGALVRLLRSRRPSLVHTNSLKAALYGGVAGRLAGVPVVWHVRDRIADDYLPRSAVRAVRALAWVLPSGVVANSQTTRETLGRLPARLPVAVVHDAVDAVAPAPPDRRNGPFTVAMVGRLAAWKGQDVFLRAFARAFPTGDERALVVGSALFGEDEFEAELRELLVELGLEGRVELTGFVEDVPSLLARVDCLVHASLIPEPFGQVVVEGMAAGLPVIASAAGGPAEVITDGIDGLLCPPADEQALAHLLSRLAGDPAERRRLATAAQQRAGQLLPGRVADALIELYRQVFDR